MTPTADPPSFHFGAINLNALLSQTVKIDTSPWILSARECAIPSTLTRSATTLSRSRERGASFEAEWKPAILPSSPGFQLRPALRDFDGQVAVAGDRAGSNLIKVNQTKSNPCAHASRPLPKETHETDLDDPLRRGIQS